MMHCPDCKSPAHAKSSRYMCEQVKERYHKCINLDCSCTLKTSESITKVITAPTQPEPPTAVPAEPVKERQNIGRYGSSLCTLH